MALSDPKEILFVKADVSIFDLLLELRFRDHGRTIMAATAGVLPKQT